MQGIVARRRAGAGFGLVLDATGAAAVRATEMSRTGEVQLDPTDAFLATRDDLGGSHYNQHRDGSGIAHVSRLRPMLNARPGYRWWMTGAGGWSLGADMDLIDWLEATGVRYDVIADDDLHEEGLALLESYRVLLTGAHPEYFTAAWSCRYALVDQRAGREPPRHRRAGRALAPPRARASAAGRRRVLRPGGRSIGALPRARPRIGDFGTNRGGAAGAEIDRADPRLGTPPHALVVATSQGEHDELFLHVIEELQANRPGKAVVSAPTCAPT